MNTNAGEVHVFDGYIDRTAREYAWAFGVEIPRPLSKLEWTDSQMERYQAKMRGIDRRYSDVMARLNNVPRGDYPQKLSTHVGKS